eukprot:s744_g25.t1
MSTSFGIIWLILPDIASPFKSSIMASPAMQPAAAWDAAGHRSLRPAETLPLVSRFAKHCQLEQLLCGGIFLTVGACRARRARTGAALRNAWEEEELFAEKSPDVGEFPWTRRVSQQLRWQMKQAEQPEDLEEEIDLALQENVFDEFAAVTAIHLCGQKGWFQQLVDSWEVAKSQRLRLHPKQQCLVFSALTSCLRRQSDATKALRLAQEVWEPTVETEEEGNFMLSSVLRLCLSLDTEEAFTWAEALWDWSHRALPPPGVNIVSYGVWLSLLERQGRFEEVNDLLMTLEGPLAPNAVVLGALLSLHATDRRWRRAAALWELLRGRGVAPNGLAFCAFARAQFLAGRPGAAVQILEDMVAEGVGEDDYRDYRYAVDYLQMLLVVCHSFPSTTNLKRLSAFVSRGAALVLHTAPPGTPLWPAWRKLCGVARRVAEREPVTLQEVLVTRRAQQSIMTEWGDKPLGSGYLWDFAYG